MAKILLSFGLLAIFILAFTSCSRALRPTKTVRKQNGNPHDDTIINNSVYDTSNIFNGSIIKNVVYNNSVINYKGSEQELALDVYKPANAKDKKFPAVILIHGGSFIGGDKKG